MRNLIVLKELARVSSQSVWMTVPTSAHFRHWHHRDVDVDRFAFAFACVYDIAQFELKSSMLCVFFALPFVYGIICAARIERSM